MKIVNISFLILSLLFLSNCGDAFKFKKVDAREFPPDPQQRVKKNMEEGRGFRLMDKVNNNTSYSFASSNPLWKATLDTLEFMPLVSANYSGGIVITDWYSENNSANESIKISVRFLTNEIRSDALSVSIHEKLCDNSQNNCKVNKIKSNLESEIKLAILKRAALLERTKFDKNSVEYRKKKGRPVLKDR